MGNEDSNKRVWTGQIVIETLNKYKCHVSSSPPQSMNHIQQFKMAQAQMEYRNQRVLLREDQIKKEIEDICTLQCYHCRGNETIDIKSIRNTTPFTCASCDLKDEQHLAEREVSLYSTTSTSQTQTIYYVHFSYPETIVTSKIAEQYSYKY